MNLPVQLLLSHIIQRTTTKKKTRSHPSLTLYCTFRNSVNDAATAVSVLFREFTVRDQSGFNSNKYFGFNCFFNCLPKRVLFLSLMFFTFTFHGLQGKKKVFLSRCQSFRLDLIIKKSCNLLQSVRWFVCEPRGCLFRF